MDRRAAEQAPGLRFLKMHGLGNDFVIIDARGAGDANADGPVTPALAKALGDRHRGVGFDQLAVISSGGNADARISFWNSDGSRAGACGNATRCIADLLMAETGAATVALMSNNGLLAAERLADGRIRVDMGPAHTGWRDIPLAREMDAVSLPLPDEPGAVSMGNPHCVHFVADVTAVNLELRGPEVEHDPLFRDRTNVQFVQILARDRVRARVWERGAGVTLASGSSSCAIVVAGYRKGLLERRITVELDGGAIEIEYREDGHVLMAGPVAYVFEGRLLPEFLAGIAP
jgi:diaminopimelate epimerase